HLVVEHLAVLDGELDGFCNADLLHDSSPSEPFSETSGFAACGAAAVRGLGGWRTPTPDGAGEERQGLHAADSRILPPWVKRSGASSRRPRPSPGSRACWSRRVRSGRRSMPWARRSSSLPMS